MKGDIKILEEFINNNFQKDKLERNEKGGFKIGTIYKTTELNPALEKLIKGYRELEGKLDSSRKANELLNKTNNELRLEIRTTYSKVVNDIISKFNLGDDYIPKSKIKEKIEKNQKMLDKSKNNVYLYFNIALQELLGEE